MIINGTVVTVKNFVFTNEFVHDGAIFRILNCCNIQLHNMMIDMKIIGHNMMGRSNLSNITSKYNGLYITFDDNISVNACAIKNELNVYNYKISFATININMIQTSYGVFIVIANSVFSLLDNPLSVYIISSYTTYENIV